MKPFEKLLTEARTTIKEISKHPEFAEMYYLGLLNNSNVSICKFWTCLEELNDAHQAIQEKKPSVTPKTQSEPVKPVQLTLF